MEKTKRGKYFWSALVMMSCVAGFYSSWKIFRPAIELANNWSGPQSLSPVRFYFLFYLVFLIVAGFWQDRKGPKFVGVAGGVLLGVSCFLSAVLWKNLMGLNVSYGILGAMGAGCIYMTSIATCLKWFPDKRGLIVGLLLLGSGVGSFLVALLIKPILGSDPAMFATTVPRTFIALGIVYMVCVIVTARVYDVPSAGWKPIRWTRESSESNLDPIIRMQEYRPGEMAKTKQFYALWVIYFLGTSVGITAIGQAMPLLKEMAVTSTVVSAGVALSFMIFSQGVGRLAWGVTSDKIGRKNTMIGMFVGYIIASMFLLRNVQNFNQALAGLCAVGFCYGGYEVVMLSVTADYYGTRNVGANYAIMYTGYAISGFIVPGYFANIVEAAKGTGNISAGYNQVYYTLAGMCLAGLALAFTLRNPVLNQKEGEGG